MVLLLDLYKTFSPSYGEKEMSQLIQKTLGQMGIPYHTDGNIVYSIKPDTALICAHMDQVSQKPITKINISSDNISADGNLGADDKNGIWIALQILKQHPELSFIFSDKEEAGGGLYDFLPKHSSVFKTIKFGIVFDRKNGSDIICNQNDYGTKVFENDIYKIGKRYGYKPTYGVFSDCDALSDYISCCNLSCGYYNAHTETEYTNIKDLNNALAFGLNIFKSINRKYKPINKNLYTWGYDDWRGYWSEGWDNNYIEYGSTQAKHKKSLKTGDEYYFCELCDDYFQGHDIDEEICPFCRTPLRKFYY